MNIRAWMGSFLWVFGFNLFIAWVAPAQPIFFSVFSVFSVVYKRSLK